MKHSFYYVGRQLLTLFLILQCSSSVMSQYSLDAPTNTTTNPSNTVLNALSSTPVNLHTGQANISIPIYEIPTHNKSYPLSLQYTGAGGIRVTDEASDVGLGWNLTPTGFITRVNQDLRDEDEYGYCGTHQIGYKVKEFAEQSLSSTQREEYYNHFIGKSTKWDTAPDEFYYSFFGVQGKFILAPDGTPIHVTQNHLNITITPAIGSKAVGNKWMIQLEDGSTLYFGEKSSSIEKSEIRGEEFISTWFIDRVVSRSNHTELSFEYKSRVNQVNPNYGKSRIDFISGSVAGRPTDEPLRGVGSFREGGLYPTVTIKQPKILANIKFDLGRLEFIYANVQRLDKLGSYPLTEIKVYNANEYSVQSISFDYSYFEHGNIQEAKRLRLDQIQFSGHPAIEFEYNPFHTLPEPSSPAIDYWGFYNSNTYEHALPPVDDLPGGNREPDAIRMQANILTKVKFPEGGYKEYKYEPHQYWDGTATKMAGGLRVREVVIHDGINNLNNRVKHFTYNLNNENRTSGALNGWLPLIHDGYSRILHMYFMNAGGFPIMTADAFVYKNRRTEARNGVGLTQGNYIGYSCVTVSETGKGKQVYKFTTFEDHPDIKAKKYDTSEGTEIDFTSNPQVPNTSLEVERGLLKELLVYHENGSLLEHTINNYDFVFDTRANNNYSLSIEAFYVYVNLDINYGNSTHGVKSYRSESVLLQESIKYRYDQNDPSKHLEQVTTYEYNTQNLLPNKITRLASDKTKFITQKRYVSDYPFSTSQTGYDEAAKAIEHLSMNNQQTTVVETQTWIEKNGTSRLINAVLTEFKLFNQVVYPHKVWQLAINQGITDYQASAINGNSFTKDNRYHVLQYFDSYDQYGNLIEERMKNGTKQAYILEYNASLPTAQVTNAAFQNVAYTSFEEALPVSRVNGQTLKLGNWNMKSSVEVNSSQECWAMRNECIENCPKDIIEDPFYPREIAPTEIDLSPKSKVIWPIGDDRCWEFCISIYDDCMTPKDYTWSLAAKAGHKSYNGEKIWRSGLKRQDYMVSFWARRAKNLLSFPLLAPYEVTINGQTFEVDNEWKLYQVRLEDITEVIINSSRAVLLDELRLYPTTAMMTTTTYYPLKGVSASADENNLFKFFTYDGANRLRFVYDQDNNLIKYNEYSH